MRPALLVVLVGCSSSGSTVPPRELEIVRIDADGGASDAAMGTEEASIGEGSVHPMGSVCDRDGDGFQAIGPPCGGDDCDDEDPRAHPGASWTYDPPTDETLGDWNCNEAIEIETVGFFVACNAIRSTSACTNAHGFLGYPACGAIDDFVTCGWIDGACAVASSTKRREGCK